MDMVLTYIYITVSVIIFIRVGMSGQLLSPLYAFVIFLMIGATLMLPVFHESYLAIFITLVVIPLLRYSYLVTIETYTLFQKIDKNSIKKKVLLGAFGRLSPIVLILFIGLFFNEMLQHHFKLWVLNKTLYDIEAPNNYGCEFNKKLLLICPENFNKSQPEGVEEDLLESIYRIRDQAKEGLAEEVLEKLDIADSKSKKGQGDIIELMFDIDEPVVPYRLWHIAPGLRPPECSGLQDWIFKTSKCIKREILNPIDTGYIDSRIQMRHGIEKIAGENNKFSADQKVHAENYLTNKLNIKIDEAANQASTSVEVISSNIKIVEAIYFWLFLLYLIFIIIKIFVYTLVRFIHSQKYGDIPLEFSKSGNTNDLIIASDITSEKGGSFEIHSKSIWYIQHSLFLGIGRVKTNQSDIAKSTKPMSERLKVRRFLTQTWRMDKYNLANTQYLSGDCGPQKRIVKVELIEGQELCLRLSNLVGFSEGLTLESHFSILSGLFLHHSMFFTIIKGKGSVIFTGGAVTLLPKATLNNSKEIGHDPLEIVAFDAKGSYYLLSNHNPLGFYLRTPTFASNNCSRAIRYSKDRMVTIIRDLIKRVLFIILPI